MVLPIPPFVYSSFRVKRMVTTRGSVPSRPASFSLSSCRTSHCLKLTESWELSKSALLEALIAAEAYLERVGGLVMCSWSRDVT